MLRWAPGAAGAQGSPERGGRGALKGTAPCRPALSDQAQCRAWEQGAPCLQGASALAWLLVPGGAYPQRLAPLTRSQENRCDLWKVCSISQKESGIPHAGFSGLLSTLPFIGISLCEAARIFSSIERAESWASLNPLSEAVRPQTR